MMVVFFFYFFFLALLCIVLFVLQLMEGTHCLVAQCCPPR